MISRKRFIALRTFSVQNMSYCSKEFLESIYLNLVKAQKPDGTNKCYLAQKRVVLFNCIFFRIIALCQSPPWQIAVPRRITPNPYIFMKNIQTLLAHPVYKQQVHPVLILSIWNKYEKLFQVKQLVNRLHTNANGIRNSEHVSTAIIYYIFEITPSRRYSM